MANTILMVTGRTSHVRTLRLGPNCLAGFERPVMTRSPDYTIQLGRYAQTVAVVRSQAEQAAVNLLHF